MDQSSSNTTDSDNSSVEPPPLEEILSTSLSCLKGKTLLLINTGSSGKGFILERIKELGIKIVMLHHEKNWASAFVDHWIIADTYNYTACAESIRKFLIKNPEIQIAGATTFWEDDIPLLAKICKEFGYIGNTWEAAQNTRSKFYMQEALRSAGRPFIPHYLIEVEEDLSKAIRVVGFPAVIKPKYGSDSQYVVFVKNEEEAREAYKYVRENCTPEFDPIYNYNEEKFVYQKFIEGQEFSIECYVQNGVPHVAGINEKTGMDLPFFIEKGDYCPARINEINKHMLVEEARAALNALGVQNSVAHMEIKLTKKGPQIIEVASRMGGVYIYKNIKQVYGFDLVQAACEIALGIENSQVPGAPQKYIFAKFFIPNTSGVITSMRGFERLSYNPLVIDYCFWKKHGDSIKVPPEGYETAGWVIAGGTSHGEAEKNMDAIMQTVHLEVSSFEYYSPATRNYVFDANTSMQILSPAK